MTRIKVDWQSELQYVKVYSNYLMQRDRPRDWMVVYFFHSFKDLMIWARLSEENQGLLKYIG